MIEIRRTFNKDRGFKLVETLNGYTFTPETNAHTFFIECVGKVNGLETVVPFEAGSTVSARFLKTNHVTELVEGSLNTDGAAVVTLPSECYSVPGRFLLTILVTTGSTTICVYAATGTVIAADSSTVNVSENASREIDEKITELNAATSNVNSAINRANNIANSLANDSANAVNAITTAGAQQRQSVNDLGDQLKDYLEDHYGETTDKVAAKANRSSVSAVKHAIGQNGQLTLTDALNEPAKKMVIHLEPKQDLHGYDKPWVGGSGKNLLPLTAQTQTVNNVTFTVRNDGTINVNGTATAQCNYLIGQINTALTGEYIISGCPAGGDSQNGYMQQCQLNGSWGASDVGNGTTVSISNKTFRLYIIVRNGYACNNLVFKPMLRLSTVTDPTYEPYSNICPIEGFDSVEVVRTGKNLCVIADQSASNIVNGGSLIQCKTGDKFYVYGDYVGSSNQTIWAGIWDSKTQNAKSVGVIDNELGNIASGSVYTFTATADGYFGMAYNAGVLTYTVNKFMISREPFTPADYEPYQGQTVSVNLSTVAGGTVYGGTVTVNEDGSGTLVVDKAKISFAGKTWAANGTFANTYGIVVTNDNPRHAVDDNLLKESLSNKYVWYNSATVGNMDYGFGMSINNDLQFYVKDKDIATVEEANSKLSDLEISYPLHYPVTYNLTATQLQTLVGENHIWTDGTNIELDYRAEKYADLDKLFAALPKDTATGNPASFTDGADGLPLDKLTVAIEPKQDLHGYDHPWIGGAGKNLAFLNLNNDNPYTLNAVTFTNVKVDGNIIGINGNGTPNSDNNFFVNSVPVTSGTEYKLCNYTETGTTSTYWVRFVFRDSNATALNVNGSPFIDVNALSSKTVTAPSNAATVYYYINFLNGVAINNVVFKFAIYVSSSAPASFEPYSNVCPIEAWDEVEVTRAGKNLINNSTLIIGKAIDAVGQIVTSAGYAYSQLIPVNPNSNYTFSLLVTDAGSSTWGRRVHAYDAKGNWISQIGYISNTATAGIRYSAQCTTPSNSRYLRVSYAGTYGVDVDAQLEAGSTATAYEPYQGQTLPISLKSVAGSSVYGGTLTVNRDGTGTLIVNRKMLTISDFHPLSSATAYKGLHWADSKISTGIVPEVLSKCSVIADRRDGNDGWGSETDCYAIGITVRVYTVETTNEAFIEKYKDLQITYGTTPTTYTLTANQLTTLLGTNHVSCDAGEVTVNYNADITTFIADMVAQALNSQREVIHE